MWISKSDTCHITWRDKTGYNLQLLVYIRPTIFFDGHHREMGVNRQMEKESRSHHRTPNIDLHICNHFLYLASFKKHV